MTSCLNHDYLILIFMHFPYLLYENPSFIIVSAETEYCSTRSWYRNINSCTPIWQNTANCSKHYTGGPFNSQSNYFFLQHSGQDITFPLATYIKKIKHISHFWDRPVPIFSDVRFSYLALVQDKKNHVRFTGKCMLHSLCQLPPRILLAFPF